MWPQIIWAVVMLVVSYALRPKPETPKPASLTDLEVPTADQNRPLPVLFGRKRIRGANVVWYGDLSTDPIKKGGK